MTEKEVSKLKQDRFVEILNLANKRTSDVVATFSGIIGTAVRMYPSGDLYDFLADQTVVFTGCVIEGGMVRIDDLEWFFADCGFDDEKIEEMVKLYAGLSEVGRRLDAGEQLLLWGAEK